MTRIVNWLAWVLVAIIALLALLNIGTLTTATTVSLGVAQLNAPLGLIMLGMTGVMIALFFIAVMRNQINALMETRSLQKELQRVQALVDQAETSRTAKLQEFIAAEFVRLNERVSRLEPPLQGLNPPSTQ